MSNGVNLLLLFGILLWLCVCFWGVRVFLLRYDLYAHVDDFYVQMALEVDYFYYLRSKFLFLGSGAKVVKLPVKYKRVRIPSCTHCEYFASCEGRKEYSPDSCDEYVTRR